VYFAFAAIYVVLEIFFIVDVIRQPASALSTAGKVLWIVALLVVPIFAWIVYGFWRIKQSRL
jgi:Phospholipase_D-nuclease N-terminal